MPTGEKTFITGGSWKSAALRLRNSVWRLSRGKTGSSERRWVKKNDDIKICLIIDDWMSVNHNLIKFYRKEQGKKHEQ